MALQNGEQRLQMLKAFDDTKAGVKGLADSGLEKLPKIFMRPQKELAEDARQGKSELKVPVLDLSKINEVAGRKQIVEELSHACEILGFFQVVNHTVPQAVMDGILDGVRRFHEQDVEEKKKYYSRDQSQLVRYSTATDLFVSTTAGWRDTLTISSSYRSNILNHDDVPTICRDSFKQYLGHAQGLVNTLLGLLSEALGLETKRLENMKCSEGHLFVGHYSPPCPEPDLAMGTLKHSDGGVLTIVLQNRLVDGLQILHQDKWIDIHPAPGGLVVNVGDLLQLLSNGKFKSVKHRVRANREGPRISVAWVFGGPKHEPGLVYGPIKELITKESPAIYKDIVMADHARLYFSSIKDDQPGIEYYKI